MNDPVEIARLAIDSLKGEWEAKLIPAVNAKVADAHAHALKALTDTLKGTNDGRASILQINRSPSYAAATNRLDELWTAMTGPSEVSLTGKIRDAREAFYRLACELTLPMIPVKIRSRETHSPNAMEVRLIRAAVLNGYDPRRVLQGPIEVAKRSLKASLEQAGRKSAPGHVEDDILKAWEVRSSSSIATTVRVLLSDSAIYCFQQAGANLIADEFKESG